MISKKIGKVARDLWQLFEALPQNTHSDRVDFEISKILVKHGIENEQIERYWQR